MKKTLLSVGLAIVLCGMSYCQANVPDGLSDGYRSVLESYFEKAPTMPVKLGKMARKNYANAENGNANAQLIVALSYSSGIGEYPVDSQAACYWFHRAAVQGSVIAQFKLAQMFGKGDGVEKNIPEAMYWYGIVAGIAGTSVVLNDEMEAYDTLHSTVKLGDNYCTSIGEKTIPGATYWQGNLANTTVVVNEEMEAYDVLYSTMKMGDYYYTGIGCKQDFEKAYRYYYRASHGQISDRHDKAKVSFRLALCYMYGRGCAANGEEAVSLLNEIVQVKDKYDKYRRPVPISLNYYCLGRCYYEGIGVAKDVKQAQKLFAKAKKLVPDLSHKDIATWHEDNLEVVLLKEMIPYADKVLAEKI